MSSTVIQVIQPYRKGSMWVFDDEAHDLKAEAFIAGASEMIDRHLAHRGIKRRKAKRGFDLVFSDRPFPGADNAHLIEEAWQGAFYRHHGHEAWLCPAMFYYFNEPPKIIYFRAEEPC